MKFSDIKVGHCYNAIFDDVRENEFNGRHLAIVLKQNNDNKTVIVVPLTTSNNGEGHNKHKIGCISTLPSSLSNRETYVVYNQVRTLNASRLINLKEGKNIIHARIPNEIMKKVQLLCIVELLKFYNMDNMINFSNDLKNLLTVRKAIDLAFQYKDNPTDQIKQLIVDTNHEQLDYDLAIELFGITPSIKDYIFDLLEK